MFNVPPLNNRISKYLRQSAAPTMAEEEVAAPMEKVIWIQRVFINLLDSYSSRNIGKFLSNCVVSGLTWRNYQRGRGRWKYLWCQKPPQPNWRKACSRSWACFPSLKSPGPILPRRHCAISWEDLLMCLLEYDVIIYNITENPQQMEEAIWAVSGQWDAPLISRDRTFLLYLRVI